MKYILIYWLITNTHITTGQVPFLSDRACTEAANLFDNVVKKSNSYVTGAVRSMSICVPEGVR